jgi:hypothetical protein
MKRMSIILILSLFSACLTAPPYVCGYIFQSEGIKVFDPILYAFQKVESNFDTDVVNSLGYTGILQEGQEMINEANRINEITGNPKRFTFPESALDSLESVQVWYVVQRWHNPKYQIKRACHVWNPLASKKYYDKIVRVWKKSIV